MNRNYIDMHLVVDRYLRDSLSDEETAEFEERLVWDHHLVDELDLAEHLRLGMHRALGKNEPSIAPNRRSIGNRTRGFFAEPLYAAAASFLLAVGLTSTVIVTQTAQTDSPPGILYARTDIVPISATRSATDISVTIEQDGWTVLLVDAPPSYDEYRVVVRSADEGTTPVWTQAALQPTYPDSLAVGMPGNLLPPGHYVLVLEGQRAGSGYEHIQDIPFISAIAE